MKLKDIILIIAILVLGYFVFQNFQSTKEWKAEKIKLETFYEAKFDTLNAHRNVLRDSITNLKALTDNVQKEGDSAQNVANKLRRSLIQLRRENPKTKDELIDNLLAQNQILESENKQLRKVIQKRDSAILIQGATINKLEKIIINRDNVIAVKDTFHIKTVELYEGVIKKQKTKSLLTKVGGIALVVLAMVI